jgi:hypothetical protein
MMLAERFCGRKGTALRGRGLNGTADTYQRPPEGEKEGTKERLQSFVKVKENFGVKSLVQHDVVALDWRDVFVCDVNEPGNVFEVVQSLLYVSMSVTFHQFI